MPHGAGVGNGWPCQAVTIVVVCGRLGGNLPTKPEDQRRSEREYVNLTPAEREAFGKAATAAHQSKAGLLHGFVIKLCKDGGWL